MADHAKNRVEGSFSQGWPFAIFITLLAVASFVAAGLIHRSTFRSPNDVTAQSRKQAPAAEGADTSSKGKAGH